MTLICRSCGEPADSSTRDHGNERWVFHYFHLQKDKPSIEHTWNVESYLGEDYAYEDRQREKA